MAALAIAMDSVHEQEKAPLSPMSIRRADSAYDATAPSDIDLRGFLRDAILECTREEVRTALRGIGCPVGPRGVVVDGCGRPTSRPRGKRRPRTATTCDVRELPRTKKKESVIPGKTRNIYSHDLLRPKTSHAGGGGAAALSIRRMHRPPALTQLEPLKECSSLAVEEEASSGKTGDCDIGISLSSFNWLEKSSSVVLEATGRMRGDICSGLAPVAPPLSRGESAPPLLSSAGESAHNIADSRFLRKTSKDHMLSSPLRPWSTPVAHPTATQSFFVAKSVLCQPRPKTTALERRRPRPGTAAVERTHAEALEDRILGPLYIHAKPSSAPLPLSLRENEWENELARNIVTLYSNRVVGQVRKEADVAAGVLESKDGEEGSDNPTLETRPMSEDSNGHGSQKRMTKKIISRQLTGTSTSNVASISGPKAYKVAIPSPNPKMIWFSGTGSIHADWTPLEQLVSDVCEQLAKLEERGEYFNYLDLAEPLCARVDCEEGSNKKPTNNFPSASRKQLWMRLVLTCIAFSVKLVEKRKYADALEMLARSKSLLGRYFIDEPPSSAPLSHGEGCENQGVKNHADTTGKVLDGHINDGYAHYYASRGKPSAALRYVRCAISVYRRLRDATNVAKCLLHKAYVLLQLGNNDESMACMERVLEMVQEGSLDSPDPVGLCGSSGMGGSVCGADPQRVLLVATAYHNIAVLQLIMGRIGEACLSSQNARRLARLCLGVSGPHIASFERTHQRALEGLTTALQGRTNNGEGRNKDGEEERIKVFRKLMDELFD